MTAKLAQARQDADEAHTDLLDAEYYEQHPGEEYPYRPPGREPPGPEEFRTMRNKASSEFEDAVLHWDLVRFAAASVADEVQLLASS
jgi:hypothetical protein